MQLQSSRQNGKRFLSSFRIPQSPGIDAVSEDKGKAPPSGIAKQDEKRRQEEAENAEEVQPRIRLRQLVPVNQSFEETDDKDTDEHGTDCREHGSGIVQFIFFLRGYHPILSAVQQSPEAKKRDDNRLKTVTDFIRLAGEETKQQEADHQLSLRNAVIDVIKTVDIFAGKLQGKSDQYGARHLLKRRLLLQRPEGFMSHGVEGKKGGDQNPDPVKEEIPPSVVKCFAWKIQEEKCAKEDRKKRIQHRAKYLFDRVQSVLLWEAFVITADSRLQNKKQQRKDRHSKKSRFLR